MEDWQVNLRLWGRGRHYFLNIERGGSRHESNIKKDNKLHTNVIIRRPTIYHQHIPMEFIFHSSFAIPGPDHIRRSIRSLFYFMVFVKGVVNWQDMLTPRIPDLTLFGDSHLCHGMGLFSDFDFVTNFVFCLCLFDFVSLLLLFFWFCKCPDECFIA